MKFSKIMMAAMTVSTLSLSSCYDLDRYPDNQLSSGTFFQTEAHAKQAMMAVYSQMQSDYVFGLSFSFDGLGGISFGYDPYSLQPFQIGTVAVNNGYVANFWTYTYEGIARANNVIQNIGGADMTDQLKAQYIGEAKFMRAVYYFHLLNLYGGVPIYDETTIIAEEFTQMLKPRNSEEEVRNFIIADLDAAATSLPASWDAANAGRATSGAATALKGKVLLFGKKYAEASQCFNSVITSGKYGLYSDYAGLFLPGGDESSEMIFAIQNLGGVGQDIGMPMAFYMGTRSTFGSCWNNVMAATTFVDSYEWADGRPFDWDEIIPGYNESTDVKAEVWYSEPNFAKTEVEEYTPYRDQLLEMYSNRDPRMAASIILPYTTYNGWSQNAVKTFEYVIFKGMGIPTTGSSLISVNQTHEAYLWRKFVPEGNMNGALNNRADTPINFPLIRYADVLLMQAECLNELGDQAGAVALINQVRNRAGMPGINSGPSYLAANSKEEVFSRIRHERRVELACEGHSYNDMKRWNLLETLNNKKEFYITGSKSLYTRSVTDRDYHWPIPSGEIDKNPDLTQNPGWQ
ncbi:MAG: RagB/SusD family nutrient uptake outer membrane protein [Bacteroides sp.]|nr:RagB/SusD family nutrient uptake outer membrane protein [Bacteroides sp.]MBD5375933.1 RagB/SusD family nutrient uptake outer membrane protein [Bacteroides sp.]MDE7460603.1 RagB/SusD family nutrient uptake outer membrane protein [Paramuribaculum sp.]